MRRLAGDELRRIQPFFVEAATEARRATCRRARCGSVLVQRGIVIGRGYNGPPLGDESIRMCNARLDFSRKPAYDRTCCVHAEWAALLDVLKRYTVWTPGSTLFFMRVDGRGKFTDAGDPFCTTCSRLLMAARVAEIGLWNRGSADMWPLDDYNRASYEYYLP